MTQDARSAASPSPRSTIVSTPDGFSVCDPNGRHIETFPFGRGKDAWELADKLDSDFDSEAA